MNGYGTVSARALALALAAGLPALAASAPAAKGQSFGNPKAPILIEIYGSFGCSHCKDFHTEIAPLLMRDFVDSGKAYLIFHDLSSALDHSAEATGYALAAARVGKYKEVADALFQYQEEWSASGKVWDAVAPVLSPADRKKVAALAKDPRVQAEVKAETEAGGRAKIGHTPTILVTHAMKERRIEGMRPDEWNIFRDWMNNDLLKK